jgi:hypothetical protein
MSISERAEPKDLPFVESKAGPSLALRLTNLGVGVYARARLSIPSVVR